MRPSLPLVLLATLILSSACAHAPDEGGTAPAASAAPIANPWTRDVAFAPMRAEVKAEAATLTGNSAEAGLYTIRVRLSPGGSIAPHTHPDARVLTVVSGEVLYGFGETADRAAAKLYRTGEVFVVPAGAPHYAFATGDEGVYQEAGMGPSAFTPIRRPSAP
jgi:quercetin dioxygenase-like cupin family protein